MRPWWIVNAVAHRDYTSDPSVQVMLVADRLEVWNPGTRPPPLTLDKLRVPHESVPGNPLLARALYLVKYIEQMGTGTLYMIARCVEAGLREPEFEATGTFVARIRRAAPAGQPVVFTDRSVPTGSAGEGSTTRNRGSVTRERGATTQERRATTQETAQAGHATTQERILDRSGPSPRSADA